MFNSPSLIQESATSVGALVSKQHYDKVIGYIQIARDEGATFHTGNVQDDEELPNVRREHMKIPTFP